MRRLVLGSAVLFIAACGGGVRPTDSGARPAPAVQRQIPSDAATAVFVQSLITQFGEDAVDTCLAAWQDEPVDPSDAKQPVDKPGPSFRAFLADCLGVSSAGGGDLRTAGGDARKDIGGGEMRSNMSH